MIAIGDVVADRYLVERLLGTGGLADVYLVRHNSLGSLHALKVLTWDRPSVDRRLLLEGQIQAQLRHPNVVAVTDVMRVNGRAALLLDYVNGPTLDVYLANATGPVDALEIFSGIIAAVVRAHDAGVLHRDLKPQNILLEPKGDRYVAKVTDFGLAKVLEEEMAAAKTRADITMGTPGYMAPEQVRDAASVDARTDIFALGALLHELLGGRPAFADESGHISLTSTLERVAPPLPDTVPEYLRKVVAEALAPDPNDRPPSARDLAERVFLPDDPRRRDVLALGGTPIALEPRREAIPAWSSVDQRTAPPLPARPTVVPDATSAEAPNRWPLLAVFLATMGVGVAGAWMVTHWVFQEPVAAAPQPVPEVPGPAPDVAVASQPVPNTPEPEPVEPEPAEAPVPAPAATANNDGVAMVAPEPSPDIKPPAPAPEPVPAEAEPVPAPAVVPEPPIVPEPAVAAEPDTKAAAAAMAKSFVGTWNGTAQGRPFSIRIDSASPSGMQGALVFPGPTQRIHELTGSADGNSLRMSDASGSVVVKGRIEGPSLIGAYTNGRRDVPFTASR